MFKFYGYLPAIPIFTAKPSRLMAIKQTCVSMRDVSWYVRTTQRTDVLTGKQQLIGLAFLRKGS